MQNNYRIRSTICIDYEMPKKSNKELKRMLDRIKRTIHLIDPNLEVISYTEFEEVLKSGKMNFYSLYHSKSQYIPDYKVNMEELKQRSKEW